MNVPALVTLLQLYNDTGDWYLGKPSLSYPLKTRDLDGAGVSLLYLEFTLNPLLLRSRGVDEEGSQSLTRVILRPISQILVNVTLKLVDACGHNSTSRKSIPIITYPLSERVLSYIKPRV